MYKLRKTLKTSIKDFKFLVKGGYSTTCATKNESYAKGADFLQGTGLLYQTTGDSLSKQVLEKPNDIAYKFCLTQTSLTFSETKQRADEFAQNLLNLGFAKGDRLALMLPNMPELNTAVLGAASIGVVSVILNPAYQLTEIEYMLKITQANGLIMLDDLKTLLHYEILTKICPELAASNRGELSARSLPHLKHVVLVKNKLVPSQADKYKGCWSFEQIEKFDSKFRAAPAVVADDTFVMLFTSGSTGFPKAATLTHLGFINATRLQHEYPGIAHTNQNICVPIPIFHTFGLVMGTLSPIVNGNRATFPSFYPDTPSTLKAIAQEKCTRLVGSPTIFQDLVNSPEREKHDLSSLEAVLMGASIVPKDLILKLKNQLKIKHILIGWAMTETACSGILTKGSDIQLSERHAYESIGTVSPFIEIKVMNTSTNTICDHNVEGELWTRSKMNMKGYWSDPVKTAETIDKDGWLRTGDIVRMDSDGYVYFQSRIKEMIIRGGANIYPVEIEIFIRTHPDVVECYAFGVKDERLGEDVAIWIKLRAESKVTPEVIREFCKGKIAHFKIPRYIKFVESFPINATGKIQKFKMTQQMNSELKL